MARTARILRAHGQYSVRRTVRFHSFFSIELTHVSGQICTKLLFAPDWQLRINLGQSTSPNLLVSIVYMLTSPAATPLTMTKRPKACSYSNCYRITVCVI